MAKDDYYVIVAKILVYLYKIMKDSNLKKEYYLAPMTEDFPISEEYFNYVIEMLEKEGYVEVEIVKAWGGNIVSIDVDNMRILPKGIDYLSDNSKIKIICETLKEAIPIISLFT